MSTKLTTTKEYSSFNDGSLLLDNDVEFAFQSSPTTLFRQMLTDDNSVPISRYQSLDERERTGSFFGGENDDYEEETIMQMIVTFFTRVPAIFISMLLVLFQTVSFGGIVFPGTWIWPSFIPHSLGFQIMLFATLIGQLFLTFSSSFDFAVALVMVGVRFFHLQSLLVVVTQL